MTSRDHSSPRSGRLGYIATVGGFIVALFAGVAALTGHLDTIWTNIKKYLPSSEQPDAVSTFTLRNGFVRDVWTNAGDDTDVHYKIEVIAEKRGPSEDLCTLEFRTQGTTRGGEAESYDGNPRGRAYKSFEKGDTQQVTTYLFDNLSAGRFEDKGDVRLICDRVATSWIPVEFPSRFQLSHCGSANSDLPKSVIDACLKK